MPDIDGFEATQQLKQHPVAAEIPVIACSALVAKDTQERAFQVGCEGFIAKPVEPKHLVEQVTKLVSTSEKKN
jgi:CheY-like chemotaxis protein